MSLLYSSDRAEIQRKFTLEYYSFLIGARYASSHTLDLQDPKGKSIPRSMFGHSPGLSQTIYVGKDSYPMKRRKFPPMNQHSQVFPSTYVLFSIILTFLATPEPQLI